MPVWRLKSQNQSSNPFSNKKMSPCVLQDIVPFGAAALPPITYNHQHTKQGKGYRWPHIALGRLVNSVRGPLPPAPCPSAPAQMLQLWSLPTHMLWNIRGKRVSGFVSSLLAVFTSLPLPNCLIGLFCHCPFPSARNLKSRVSFLYQPCPSVCSFNDHHLVLRT